MVELTWISGYIKPNMFPSSLFLSIKTVSSCRCVPWGLSKPRPRRSWVRSRNNGRPRRSIAQGNFESASTAAKLARHMGMAIYIYIYLCLHVQTFHTKVSINIVSQCLKSSRFSYVSFILLWQTVYIALWPGKTCNARNPCHMPLIFNSNSFKMRQFKTLCQSYIWLFWCGLVAGLVDWIFKVSVLLWSNLSSGKSRHNVLNKQTWLLDLTLTMIKAKKWTLLVRLRFRVWVW